MLVTIDFEFDLVDVSILLHGDYQQREMISLTDPIFLSMFSLLGAFTLS